MAGRNLNTYLPSPKSILSAINANISLFSWIYFTIYLTQFYFYFIILINEDNYYIFKKIFNFIVTLYLIQIPAIWIKFFLIGQSEKGGIGTVSTEGGSISTILPLVAICFSISHYLFKREKKY